MELKLPVIGEKIDTPGGGGVVTAILTNKTDPVIVVVDWDTHDVEKITLSEWNEFIEYGSFDDPFNEIDFGEIEFSDDEPIPSQKPWRDEQGGEVNYKEPF